MNEAFLGNKLRTTAAVLAAAGSLMLSGCGNNTDPNGEPSHKQNYGALAETYKTELGLNGSIIGILQTSGPNVNLDTDVADRSINFAGNNFSPTSATPGSYIPGNFDSTYQLSKAAAAKADPYSEWSIVHDKIPVYPIARLSGNGQQLNLLDQRPPKARRDETDNTSFTGLRQNVIAPIGKLLTLAIQKQAVKKVNFEYDFSDSSIEKKYGADSSEYKPNSKVVHVVVNKAAPTPYDSLRMTLTHETGHALFGQTALDESTLKSDPELTKELQTTCREIRKDNLDSVAPHLTELIPMYEKLGQKFKKIAPATRYLVSRLRLGEADSVQYNSKNLYMGDNFFPDCQLGKSADMLQFISDKKLLGIDLYTQPTKFSRMLETIDGKFFSIFRKATLNTAMSEYGYTKDEYFGHPEDNLSELSASLFDLAINKPVEFKAKVDTLQPKQQVMVKRVYKIIRHAYTKTHPELKTMLPDLFRK
jgi:hypothetical protein